MKYLLLLVMLTYSLFSEEFEVTKITGKALLNNQKEILIGDKIKESDFLMIAEKSVVVVKNDKNKSLEIRSSGRYSGSKMALKLKLGTTNVSSALDKNILNDLSESEDLLAVSDIKSNMKQLGAVERAFVKNDFIISPRNSYILNKEVQFKWEPLENNTSYEFILISIEGNILHYECIDTNFIYVNLSEIELKEDECYFWYVIHKNIHSEEYCITKMNSSTIFEVDQGIFQLESLLSTKDASDWLILAKFYESNNLMQEAIYCYEKTIELSGNNKDYIYMYYKYLTLKGIKNLPTYE